MAHLLGSANLKKGVAKLPFEDGDGAKYFFYEAIYEGSSTYNDSLGCCVFLGPPAPDR
jgi:hypothetical protein